MPCPWWRTAPTLVCASARPLSMARSALPAVALGGLVAGTLDILYAFVFWHFRDVVPGAILRSVASGVLGAAAYEGGTPAALLGLGLHFVIALGWAALFYVAARRFSALVRHAAVTGMLYGVGVYVLMNYVVVPLSASPLTPPHDPVVVVGGVFAHVFLIGLPIALIARRTFAQQSA